MDIVERVGVIPRALARTLDLLHHGFTPLRDPFLLARIESAIRFVARDQVEDDPEQKQIIPYGVVCQQGRVFVMERLQGCGEKRLHGKVALGVGGHINPLDRAGEGLIAASFQRELGEELIVSGIESIVPRGFINDDSQPVGSVHLGVVLRVELTEQGCARVRETDALTGRFLPWNALDGLRTRMETWSDFVLEAHQAGHLSQ